MHGGQNGWLAPKCPLCEVPLWAHSISVFPFLQTLSSGKCLGDGCGSNICHPAPPLPGSLQDILADALWATRALHWNSVTPNNTFKNHKIIHENIVLSRQIFFVVVIQNTKYKFFSLDARSLNWMQSGYKKDWCYYYSLMSNTPVSMRTEKSMNITYTYTVTRLYSLQEEDK